MELEFVNAEITEDNKSDYIGLSKNNTLMNYVCSDFEIDFPKGYSIQLSATKNNAYSTFYSSAFFNVKSNNFFYKKEKFEYDFSFVGCDRPPIRRAFFQKLQMYFRRRKDINAKLSFNEHFFFNFSEEEKMIKNNANNYEQILRDSKFSLCPMGGGLQSIRFYESLAVNTVPIYIGDKETKFPLEWIIDWDKVCFRINTEEVYNLKFLKKLDHFLNVPLQKINEMRGYVFGIYNEYLVDQKKLLVLVSEKIKESIL